MKRRFWAAVSDQGVHRKKNQDAVYCKEVYSSQGHILLACVCDGVGSFEYSERASAMIMQGIALWMESLQDGKIAQLNAQELQEDLLLTLTELSEIIYEQQYIDKVYLGCTMSLLLLMDHSYYSVHAGDSRIYYGIHSLTQMTEDDVKISEKDGKKKLCNCMGYNKDTRLHQYSGYLPEESIFILGSDGLFHRQNVEDSIDDICKVRSMSQMRDLCEHMIEKTRLAGERDNVSCIIIGPEKEYAYD